MQKTNLFSTFPTETKEIIFSYISNRDRMNLRQISKQLNEQLRNLSPPSPSITSITPKRGDRKQVGDYLYPVVEISWLPSNNETTNGHYLRIEAVKIPIQHKNNRRTKKKQKGAKKSPHKQHKKSFTQKITQQEDKVKIDFSSNHRSFVEDDYKYIFRVVAFNNFGVTPSPPMVYGLIRENVHYFCFNSNAKIHMYDGTLREARDVEIGDVLLSANGVPSSVVRVKTTQIEDKHMMVQLGDFFITRGHPIFVDGEWYRPDELFPTCIVWIDTLYNFFVEPDHFIVVGEELPYVCSSLGGYCPRLAKMDPYSDILYGRGYGTKEAEQYSWLLSLKERIPYDQVVPKDPVSFEDHLEDEIEEEE